MSKLYSTIQDFLFPSFGILLKISPSYLSITDTSNIGLFMHGFFFLVNYLKNSKSLKKFLIRE